MTRTNHFCLALFFSVAAGAAIVDRIAIAAGDKIITASEIDSLLMKVKTERHTTMVIVTHDIHGARKIADKFAVLDQGRVLAFGTPAELDKKQDNRLQQFISER